MVYVDSNYAKLGRMKMCHMMADTTKELTSMADAIGLSRKWIQCRGQWKEHFDVSMGKRKEAVKRGAIESTGRDMVRRFRGRGSKEMSHGERA